ncbi:MAG: hypothetical protein M3Z32_09875 [Acidobacteriota bacterium]|nr:hypothetical protein [Acidobacteriota bacterium]
MSRKSIAVPDSDETARKPDAAAEADEVVDDAGEYEGGQTSNKTGKRIHRAPRSAPVASWYESIPLRVLWARLQHRV